MNKRQLEVQKAYIRSEKSVIRDLKKVYTQAKKDCEAKIKQLAGRTDTENLQTIVYQMEYQKAIKQQLEAILDTLQTNQFNSIAEYLGVSYEDGFIGTLYDLQGQGIPFIFPIDQNQVTKALQNDLKLSDGLYSRLGEDMKTLKKNVRAEVSRGIANGQSWWAVAEQIANGMNSPFDKAMFNAIRIARTEGHRIANQAQLDTIDKAKKKGADIVKQWDATLDGRTRDEHREADGQIREIDEYFDVGGEKMKAPGVGGSARNVCNCRCCMLQRARWALDEDELKVLEERAKFFGLDKTADFEDYKKKFKIAAKVEQAVADLDACKTTADVEGLLKSKGWFHSKEINGKTYDSNESSTLTGCDVAVAKEIYTAYERLYARYPQLIGKLNGINAGTLKGGTYAQCSVGLGHGGVSINTTYFGDEAKIKRSYERDVSSGFHPTGTTYRAIVTHEVGHAIDDYLTNTLHASGFKNAWSPKYVSADLRPKVMKACGFKVADAYSQISGYASKDHYEWFAECFAEWMESENPRAVAAEFGKRLEELLKGVT